VVDAMLPYFTEHYGNPASAHGFGRKAEQAVEDARETIARLLNCKPSEIVFTSGGTESDNLAIRGAALTARQTGRANHLVTTSVEHNAVGKTVEDRKSTRLNSSHVKISYAVFCLKKKKKKKAIKTLIAKD